MDIYKGTVMQDSKEIIISQNRWSSYRATQYEGSDELFYHLHDERSSIGLVSVLPYRYFHANDEVGRRKKHVEYLICHEVVVAWDAYITVPCSITGSVEEGMTPAQTAVHEIEEEGGYKVSIDELIPLGATHADKHCSAFYYLFTVDLTGKERGQTMGDGSMLEKSLLCEWTQDLGDVLDPLVFASHYRMRIKG